MRALILGRVPSGRGRRIVVAGAVLAAFAGLVGVTQISNAETEPAEAACRSAAPSAAGDPSASAGTPASQGDRAADPSAAPPSPRGIEDCEKGGGKAPATEPGGDGSLRILGNNCDDSKLAAHTGFQEGNRCVRTAFGEVGAAEQNPTLLIAEAPETVRVGQPFRLKVSTRNLVRDRFLPAAKGGYYVESSLLTDEGLVRGHFHTACRMLTSTKEAVDPAPVPAFFVATEDGRGGAEPDTVTIQVSGLPQQGIAQCAAWAGDGSHRIPMMQRANQTPAIDAVRIRVEPAAEQPPAEQPPAEQPDGQSPGQQPGQQQPGQQEPGKGQQPDQQEPGKGQPPAGDPAPDKPAQTPSRPAAPSADENTERPARGENNAAAPARAVAGAPAKPTRSPATDRDNSTPAVPEADDAVAGNPGNPPATDAAVASADGRLALTGSSTLAVVVSGAALLAAGAMIVQLARRRRYRSVRH